jgi:hypothetical protein
MHDTKQKRIKDREKRLLIATVHHPVFFSSEYYLSKLCIYFSFPPSPYISSTWQAHTVLPLKIKALHLFRNYIFKLFCKRSRDSSVAQRWATDCMIGDSIPGGGAGNFSPHHRVHRPALGPTQPHIQWVLGALSLEVKRSRSEADRSPASSTEVKEWVELYLHYPTRLHGVVLS